MLIPLQTDRKERGRTIFLICVLCIIIGMATRIGYIIRYPIPPRDSYTYEE